MTQPAAGAIRVHVRLRGEDLAALSALEVLREEMGARDLAALSRETVWEVELPGGPDGDYREALDLAARESLLFANPVKQRWRFETGPYRLEAPARGSAAGLLVRDRTDRRGPALAAALAERYLIPGARARSATLWILSFEPGVRAPGERALDLGVTRSRREGILVNPHFQEHDVLV